MLVFFALVAGVIFTGALSANLISPTALNAARFRYRGYGDCGGCAATTACPKGATAGPLGAICGLAAFRVYFVLVDVRGRVKDARGPRQCGSCCVLLCDAGDPLRGLARLLRVSHDGTYGGWP